MPAPRALVAAQGMTGFAGSVGMLLGCRMLLGMADRSYLVGGTKVVSLCFRCRSAGSVGLFDAARARAGAEGLT